jgi:site-specific recombinase XerD
MRPGCLLDSIDTSDVAGHRDKALLATLAYTCSRIGAVVNLMVEDYFQNGKKSVIRLSIKGGKEKEFPVNHVLEEILDASDRRVGDVAILGNNCNSTLKVYGVRPEFDDLLV